MQILNSLMALGLAAVAAASGANAADLTVEVAGIRKADGNIMIAVYDTPEKFLTPGGFLVGTRMPADAAGVIHTFTGLEPGEYAVSVFHDVDANGKLDSNFMGIPKEPVGISRDARGSFGPPKFRDAAFKLTAEGSRQKVYLD
ncbi:DUF2141 domain-containing protein [Kordiimonas sp.]|uniref:DUF2141 domain-containing protein n=1 Tax=Kordiimonas sp. TaxID=1970157 RepID=UPI003A8EE924